MSKQLRLILAGILIAVGLFGEQILEFAKNNVNIVNTPSVDISEPDLSYKTLVEDCQDGHRLKRCEANIRFFLTLSDVVELDPGFVDTTEKFMVFNKTSGGLNFSGLEMKNKYEKLGENIDMVIAATIGLENVPMTAEVRKDLCDCLDAIAWSVNQ